MGTKLDGLLHEIHQRFPTRETHITQEGAHVIEEGLAGGQAGANKPVRPVTEGKEGVE